MYSVEIGTSSEITVGGNTYVMSGEISTYCRTVQEYTTLLNNVRLAYTVVYAHCVDTGEAPDPEEVL